MVNAELMRAWQIKLPTMTLAALRELYEAFKFRVGDAEGSAAEKPLHAVTRPASMLILAPILKRPRNGRPETVAEVLERWPDDDELEIEGAVDGLALALAELGENPEDW